MLSNNDPRGIPVQLASGRPWYPFAPRPEDVHLDDVALSLSRTCRFGGHVKDGVSPYYNAEHAVRVAWVVRDLGGSALECLAALHHDSHEAFPPGDQLGPFLRAMKDEQQCALIGLTPAAFAGVLEVARLAALATRTAFGVQSVFDDPHGRALVKKADTIMLAVERRDLMAESAIDWGSLPDVGYMEQIGEKIVRRLWTPWRCWDVFLRTHEQLAEACGL